MIFVFPLLLLVPAAAALMEGDGKLKKGFEFSSKYWVVGLGALAFFGVTFFFLAQPIAFVFSIHDVGERPISKDLLDLLTEFVQQFLATETSYYMVVSNSIRQLVYLTALIVLLPLLMIATAFMFYSAREELEALGLKQELEKFGKRNRLQETTHDYED
jgi:thiosulfate reductase cytochrome b subunit